MGSVTFGPVHDTPPFFRRHLEDMTSVQFIEEGEWAGFEALPPFALRALNGYKNERVIFDEATRGLRFKTSPSSVNPNILVLRSNEQRHRCGYEDWYFTGTVMKDTGVIVMSKIGLQSHLRFWWKGLMTPFGILCSGAIQSWFWLWKEDWTLSR